MPYLTVLGTIYFVALLAWAVMSFDHHRANSRPAASLSSSVLLALGVLIAAHDWIVRQPGYCLFGLSIVLCGAGHGLALRGLAPGLIRALTLGVLTASVVVALASLAVQIRERGAASRI